MSDYPDDDKSLNAPEGGASETPNLASTSGDTGNWPLVVVDEFRARPPRLPCAGMPSRRAFLRAAVVGTAAVAAAGAAFELGPKFLGSVGVAHAVPSPNVCYDLLKDTQNDVGGGEMYIAQAYTNNVRVGSTVTISGTITGNSCANPKTATQSGLTVIAVGTYTQGQNTYLQITVSATLDQFKQTQATNCDKTCVYVTAY